MVPIETIADDHRQSLAEDEGQAIVAGIDDTAARVIDRSEYRVEVLHGSFFPYLTHSSGVRGRRTVSMLTTNLIPSHVYSNDPVMFSTM